MKLFLASQTCAMLANGRWNAERPEDPTDFRPVVKLFVPWGAATWLLTELDPQNPDIAFGLCDLGMQSPELGSVSLSEITAVRGPGGLTIERDRHFTANKTLSEYATEARREGRIKA
jgi:hypothetical protein